MTPDEYEELQGELNDERVLHRKTRGRLHEAEARLDRIAALLPEPSPLGGVDMIDADRVRAILAEVTPERGGVLDRDQARPIAYEYLDPYGIHGQPEPHAVRVVEDFLDRLQGCVRPAARPYLGGEGPESE